MTVALSMGFHCQPGILVSTDGGRKLNPLQKEDIHKPRLKAQGLGNISFQDLVGVCRNCGNRPTSSNVQCRRPTKTSTITQATIMFGCVALLPPVTQHDSFDILHLQFCL